MNTIKRLALRAIFTREQRVVIWNALQYSFYRYDKRGNVKRAIRVGRVIDDVDSVFHDNRKKYTEREVVEIVKGAIHDTLESVSEIVKECKAKKDGTCVEVHLMPGAVLDREKCNKCEHKDECEVNHFVFDEDKETETETAESTAEAKNTGEQARKGNCDTVGTQAAAEKIAAEEAERDNQE